MPHSQLKFSQLFTQDLTYCQRIEVLHQMWDLGSFELLASMLELCPKRNEMNKSFLFLFLQRLLTKL
jgi:hypothetical protein